MKRGNFFNQLTTSSQDEIFELLCHGQGVRIERIISHGQATPAGEWYDQAQAEWVVLLRGAAGLVFEDGREITLMPGDWLEIPAHCRHRVSWTASGQQSLWLAVHYPPGTDDAP